jgi:hypothetical protein
VPLAIMVGYLLTNPLDYSTLALYGFLALLLVFPLLLRWHYSLLLFSWSSAIILFFLKGAPTLWIVMVVLSLGISTMERILLPNRYFIRVPQISWPLICLMVVILFTAKLTGGIGLHAFGSEVYGGRKYVFLLIGILSYFAITAQSIPPDKVKWFVGLFFLGETTKLVGDLYPLTPSFLHFIFWFFPAVRGYYDADTGFQLGVTRLGGVGSSGVAICMWMLARYGIRRIFMEGKFWRPVLWVVSFMLVFMGGFRTAVFAVSATFLMMFFMEGLHRTRLLLVFAMLGIMATVAVVPLASHLPFTFQRALAFLPLDISPEAKMSAEGSSDWRLAMWKALLPQVPKHLLLGKGLAITMEDYQNMGNDSAFRAIDASQDGLALSGDYHNGILSVVLPFGLWGLIAYVWFMVAGLWVLYNNWKHGNPALQTINALLFVLCIQDFLGFISCYAGFIFFVGCGFWAGHVGLSVALNNGVCRKKKPAAAERPAVKLVRTFPRLRPGFQ